MYRWLTEIKMRHKFIILLFLLIMSSALNTWLLANRYASKERDITKEINQVNNRYLSEYQPYIADAKQRWSSKNRYSQDPFRNRTTSVVTLNDRICVSFEYNQPDIGGAPPFYCYSFDSVELIDKRDDVE